MNKTLSAATAAMLLVTSSAWGTTPEGQETGPMGDNLPDPSPTEQAEQESDPVPMDSQRVRGNPRQDRQIDRPEDAQDSLDEYQDPQAAGEEPDEERENTDQNGGEDR